MEEEISNMKSRKVWDLVPRPEGVKVVGCRWVYALKKNSQGKIIRFKSRLVAQGFSQQKGENYDETPTRLTTRAHAPDHARPRA